MKIHSNTHTDTLADLTSSLSLIAHITLHKKGKNVGRLPMNELTRKVKLGTATVVETQVWYDNITKLIRLNKLYD